MEQLDMITSLNIDMKLRSLRVVLLTTDPFKRTLLQPSNTSSSSGANQFMNVLIRLQKKFCPVQIHCFVLKCDKS